MLSFCSEHVWAKKNIFVVVENTLYVFDANKGEFRHKYEFKKNIMSLFSRGPDTDLLIVQTSDCWVYSYHVEENVIQVGYCWGGVIQSWRDLGDKLFCICRNRLENGYVYTFSLSEKKEKRKVFEVFEEFPGRLKFLFSQSNSHCLLLWNPLKPQVQCFDMEKWEMRECLVFPECKEKSKPVSYRKLLYVFQNENSRFIAWLGALYGNKKATYSVMECVEEDDNSLSKVSEKEVGKADLIYYLDAKVILYKTANFIKNDLVLFYAVNGRRVKIEVPKEYRFYIFKSDPVKKNVTVRPSACRKYMFLTLKKRGVELMFDARTGECKNIFCFQSQDIEWRNVSYMGYAGCPQYGFEVQDERERVDYLRSQMDKLATDLTENLTIDLSIPTWKKRLWKSLFC